MNRALILVVAAIVSACAGTANGTRTNAVDKPAAWPITPQPMSSSPSREFYRRYVSVRNSDRLDASQQRELQRIASAVKPAYRHDLAFTFTRAGEFIVIIAYDNTSFIISSCQSPPPGSPCRHDCSLGLETQFWSVHPLVEFGRCQDASPVWLRPDRRLAPHWPM